MKLSFVTRHSRGPNQNHCPQWGALPGVPSLERCVIDFKKFALSPSKPFSTFFWIDSETFVSCLYEAQELGWQSGFKDTYPGKRIFKKQMQTKKKEKKKPCGCLVFVGMRRKPKHICVSIRYKRTEPRGKPGNKLWWERQSVRKGSQATFAGICRMEKQKKNENNNQYGLPKSVGERFEGHIYTLKKFSDIISLKDQSRQLKEGTEKKKKKTSEMTRGQRAAVGIFRTCSWLRIYRLFSLMLSKSGSWYQKRAGHTCRERGAVVVTSDLNVF